jgi:predicted nucleotidyltransferase
MGKPSKAGYRTSFPDQPDPRYFTSEGEPNKTLIDAQNRVLLAFQKHSRTNEEVRGLYVVGSVSVGNGHDDSDLDLYIKSNVGFSRGKELSNLIIDEINPALQCWQNSLKSHGIDPLNLDRDDLKSRGLVREGEEQSLILILSRLGEIKKRDMIDVTVGSGIPWGRCYDLERREWIKYKDGDKIDQGPISEFFKYGS